MHFFYFLQFLSQFQDIPILIAGRNFAFLSPATDLHGTAAASATSPQPFMEADQCVTHLQQWNVEGLVLEFPQKLTRNEFNNSGSCARNRVDL